MRVNQVIYTLKIFFERVKLTLSNISGEATISLKNTESNKDDQPQTTAVKIGGTTYLVSSIFNNKARGNVIDRVARLIDKEVSLSSEK